MIHYLMLKCELFVKKGNRKNEDSFLKLLHSFRKSMYQISTTPDGPSIWPQRNTVTLTSMLLEITFLAFCSLILSILPISRFQKRIHEERGHEEPRYFSR